MKNIVLIKNVSLAAAIGLFIALLAMVSGMVMVSYISYQLGIQEGVISRTNM